MSLLATVVGFKMSAFPPVAVGFMGLGTGYLVYGPQGCWDSPNEQGDRLATGIWGIAMPGFMQLYAGAYVFFGRVLGTFTAKAFYMAGWPSRHTESTGSPSAGTASTVPPAGRAWA